jgi:hypothetical protein
MVGDKAWPMWGVEMSLCIGGRAVKEVVYGYQLQQDRGLLRLAEQRTAELEEVVGVSAPRVSAEWDRSQDAQGRPVVTLRLAEPSGSVTTVFEPKELESPDRMRRRFNRLWRDLLQIRIDKQLQEVRQDFGLEGG